LNLDLFFFTDPYWGLAALAGQAELEEGWWAALSITAPFHWLAAEVAEGLFLTRILWA